MRGSGGGGRWWGGGGGAGGGSGGGVTQEKGGKEGEKGEGAEGCSSGGGLRVEWWHCGGAPAIPSVLIAVLDGQVERTRGGAIHHKTARMLERGLEFHQGALRLWVGAVEGWRRRRRSGG